MPPTSPASAPPTGSSSSASSSRSSSSAATPTPRAAAPTSAPSSSATTTAPPPAFGPLLVGSPAGPRLVYAGKVGTGYTEKLLKDLHRQLKPITRKDSPF